MKNHSFIKKKHASESVPFGRSEEYEIVISEKI